MPLFSNQIITVVNMLKKKVFIKLYMFTHLNKQSIRYAATYVYMYISACVKNKTFLYSMAHR